MVGWHCCQYRLSFSAERCFATSGCFDKDNHLRDALKYILLSSPSPSEIPARLRRDDMIADAFANGRQATLGVLMAQFDARNEPRANPFHIGPNGRRKSEWEPTRPSGSERGQCLRPDQRPWRALPRATATTRGRTSFADKQLTFWKRRCEPRSMSANEIVRHSTACREI